MFGLGGSEEVWSLLRECESVLWMQGCAAKYGAGQKVPCRVVNWIFCTRKFVGQAPPKRSVRTEHFVKGNGFNGDFSAGCVRACALVHQALCWAGSRLVGAQKNSALYLHVFAMNLVSLGLQRC